jgi:ABC-type nitrate/sulfonate/bicarbonate transport system permease component
MSTTDSRAPRARELVVDSTTSLATVKKKREFTRTLWYRPLGWVTLAALLGAWQIYGTVVTSASVVTFSEAVVALWKLLTGPSLLLDIVPSVVRMLLGFVFAAFAGLLIGLLLGVNRRLAPWLTPLLEFGRAVPPPLVIPIAMVIMGFGEQLVIFTIALGAFWPVLLNTIDGVRRVEPLFLDTAKALHLTPLRGIRDVILPAALPTIMAGLRIALSISLIMMVLSEMLAANNGIGYQLLFAQQTFRVPTTYGGVVLLAILGWAFDTIFVLIERRVLRSHPSNQGGTDV